MLIYYCCCCCCCCCGGGGGKVVFCTVTWKVLVSILTGNEEYTLSLTYDTLQIFFQLTVS